MTDAVAAVSAYQDAQFLLQPAHPSSEPLYFIQQIEGKREASQIYLQVPAQAQRSPRPVQGED